MQAPANPGKVFLGFCCLSRLPLAKRFFLYLLLGRLPGDISRTLNVVPVFFLFCFVFVFVFLFFRAVC